MLLTEHLVRCETGGIDVFTPWYKSCIERLQQIFLQVSLISQLEGCWWEMLHWESSAAGALRLPESSSRWQQHLFPRGWCGARSELSGSGQISAAVRWSD